MNWAELTSSGRLSSFWMEGDDTQQGTKFNTHLYGGEGDDKLYGSSGNDVLEGGAGTDYLEGGAGNDVYVFGKGYGNDAVYAHDNSSSKRDTVRLAGLTADEVEFMTDRDASSSDHYHLIIRIKETGETLTIQRDQL